MSISKAANTGVDEVSPLLFTCFLFACHSGINALLLTPLNPNRCVFWSQQECSADAHWIANWFSFAHAHVAALLTAMALVAMKETKLETTVSYCTAAVIFIYIAEGLFSTDIIHQSVAMFEAAIFVAFLGLIAYFSNQHDKAQPLIALPPKLTTSSFDQRSKVSVSQVAVGAQLVSAGFRVFGMAFADEATGRKAYLGDMSSSVYQNISSMALCDMMIVAMLLGISLRFFEGKDLKMMLWVQAIMLFISQAMLAGNQGDMISVDEIRAGGVGTFISILVSLLGVLH